MLFTVKNLLAQEISIPHLVPYLIDSQFCIYNSKTHSITKAKFDLILPFKFECAVENLKDKKKSIYGNEYFATVLIKNKLYRVDSLGNIKLQFKEINDWECVPPSMNQIKITFKENEKVGIKINDSIIIPALYDEIEELTTELAENYYVVTFNGTCALFKNNTPITPFKYTSISDAQHIAKNYKEIFPLLFVEFENQKYYIDIYGIEYKK